MSLGENEQKSQRFLSFESASLLPCAYVFTFSNELVATVRFSWCDCDTPVLAISTTTGPRLSAEMDSNAKTTSVEHCGATVASTGNHTGVVIIGGGANEHKKVQ